MYLTWPVPDCAPGCPSNWLKDGFCDQPCNTSACAFDGGDCQRNSTDGQSIPTGYRRFDSHLSGAIGNYNHHLNAMYFNTIKPSGSFPAPCAISCINTWIGDRFCDRSCNNVHCAFDAGDCGYQNYPGKVRELIFDRVADVDVSKESSVELNQAENVTKLWIFRAIFDKNVSIPFYVNFTAVTKSEVMQPLIGLSGYHNEVTRFQVIDEDGSNCTKMIRRVRLDQKEQILTIILLPQFIPEMCGNITLRVVLSMSSNLRMTKMIDGRDWDQKIQLQFIREEDTSTFMIGIREVVKGKEREIMTKNNNNFGSAIKFDTRRKRTFQKFDSTSDFFFDKSPTTSADKNGFNISLPESKRQVETEKESGKVKMKQIDGRRSILVGREKEEINELQEEASFREGVVVGNDFVTLSSGSTTLSTGSDVESFPPSNQVLLFPTSSRLNVRRRERRRSPEEEMSQTMINGTKGDSDQRRKGRRTKEKKVIVTREGRDKRKKVHEEGEWASSHQAVSSGVQLSRGIESWRGKDNLEEEEGEEARTWFGEAEQGRNRHVRRRTEKYNPDENHVDSIESRSSGRKRIFGHSIGTGTHGKHDPYSPTFNLF